MLFCFLLERATFQLFNWTKNWRKEKCREDWKPREWRTNHDIRVILRAMKFMSSNFSYSTANKNNNKNHFRYNQIISHENRLRLLSVKHTLAQPEHYIQSSERRLDSGKHCEIVLFFGFVHWVCNKSSFESIAILFLHENWMYENITRTTSSSSMEGWMVMANNEMEKNITINFHYSPVCPLSIIK